MGWWFGRIMTFEVVGEVDPPSIGAVLNDASKGLIAADAPQEIGGYAAYGQSIRAAIQPLVDCYAVELFDDGSNLRPPSTVDPQLVGGEDFGNSAGYEPAPRIEREQAPARTLPGTLRLGYYDPERDYQAGEARASASEQQLNEERSELPGAVTAADAKSLSQQMLAREWARRDRLTLRLSPRFLGLEPGARLQLPLNPSIWSVERCTIDGFVVAAELRPAWIASPPMLAEAGRIRANIDVEAGPLSLALLDVRDVLSQDSDAPTLLLAASTATGVWKRRSVEISFAGQSIITSTARRKSVLGRALTVLPRSEPYLIDNVSTVDVELVDPDQWLTSCDDDALAAGANVAVIGSELIQFGDAAPLGQGQFRLSRLLRGQGGTERACSNHAVDEVFCVIERGAVQPLPMPSWSVGALVTASAQNSPAASTIISAETQRPPAPVNLAATIQPTGDLFVSWTRRSRAGWAWIDEIDAPLAERVEQYRIAITGSAGSADLISDQQTLLVPAATVAGLGTGLAAIEVRQVGDLSASRSAQLSINLP
jgi:hypothetical protein